VLQEGRRDRRGRVGPKPEVNLLRGDGHRIHTGLDGLAIQIEKFRLRLDHLGQGGQDRLFRDGARAGQHGAQHDHVGDPGVAEAFGDLVGRDGNGGDVASLRRFIDH